MRATAIFIQNMKHGNLFPSLTLLLDSSHLLFGDELIVCADAADLVQGIGQFRAPIERHVPLIFDVCKIHPFERVQDFLAGMAAAQLFFQDAVDKERQKAGQEMDLDPVFEPHKRWSGLKIRLHDAEAFLYLRPVSTFYIMQLLKIRGTEQSRQMMIERNGASD